MIRYFKALIKRTIQASPDVDWTTLLLWVQQAINVTASSSTGFAPHTLFFGIPAPNLFDADAPTLEFDTELQEYALE